MSPRCVITVLLFSSLFAGPVPAQEAPRLAVVLVADQMRADYLERFAPYFGPGGFRRLREEGTVFTECRYRYSGTKTAPGHACVSTGVFSAQHGIVANEWIDRSNWAQVASVEDPAMPLVGAGPKHLRSPGGVLEAKSGRSPRFLLAPTLGDRMKAEFGERCRVVSVAKKDRSAILLGGHQPDAVFWLDETRFVTSVFYRPDLPEWVQAFNAVPRVERSFGTIWDRLLPAAEYDKTQGPDDVEGEDPASGLGRTFPHRIDGGGTAMGKSFLDAYDLSPLNSELVGEFTQAALHGEKLGTHAATDLLCVSFSQVDSCGHNFGPDSHEVMDSMIRLDRVLAALFAEFDRTVGAGRWVLVLTADHAVMPLPEVLKQRDPSIDTGRFQASKVDRLVEEALATEFGPLPAGGLWTVRDGLGYHVRPKALAAKELTLNRVLPVLRRAIAAAPGVAQVFSREEIAVMPLTGDDVPAMLRRSYYAPTSPDVMFLLKPFWVDRASAGTTHGLPYDYDTHVPLVWYGAGVPKAVRTERVGVDDLVPTLAELIGIKPPAQAEGRRLFLRR